MQRGASDFLRDADTALYFAKEHGRGRYAVFSSNMSEGNRNRLDLEEDIRLAFERGEFSVVYQPRYHLGTGRTDTTLTSADRPVRALLIGGEPLGEQIVMWWNFVGRSHDEIAGYRADWMSEIGAGSGEIARARDGSGPPRFGEFPAGEPAALPAPALPTVRMRPRG